MSILNYLSFINSPIFFSFNLSFHLFFVRVLLIFWIFILSQYWFFILIFDSSRFLSFWCRYFVLLNFVFFIVSINFRSLLRLQLSKFHFYFKNLGFNRIFLVLTVFWYYLIGLTCLSFCMVLPLIFIWVIFEFCSRDLLFTYQLCLDDFFVDLWPFYPKIQNAFFER